jgi:hypothetical protein
VIGDGGGCFYLDVGQKGIVCIWRRQHSGLEVPVERPSWARVPFRLDIHPSRIVVFVIVRGRILGASSSVFK